MCPARTFSKYSSSLPMKTNAFHFLNILRGEGEELRGRLKRNELKTEYAQDAEHRNAERRDASRDH